MFVVFLLWGFWGAFFLCLPCLGGWGEIFKGGGGGLGGGGFYGGGGGRVLVHVGVGEEHQ